MIRAVAALVLLLLGGAVSPAAALVWGGIEPGVTTVDGVRARYGAPSKESRPRVEGYDTLQWVYENDRAPAGLYRLTVDFGLLTPSGYRPDVVRIFTLEPKPNIFGRNTVIDAFGVPDGLLRNKDGTTTAVWKAGLHAVFDQEERNAVTMVFSMPQPLPEEDAGAKPAAPPAASAPGRPSSGAPAPKR